MDHFPVRYVSHNQMIYSMYSPTAEDPRQGAAKVGETLDGIKFHRVIDNKSLGGKLGHCPR
jgi:hypothetical protein